MAVSNTTTAAKDPTDMSTAILIRVDQTGKGDFGKIQDAIDSVPSNNSELVFISIKPGTYREKIVVPADKPFITLSGTKSSDTIITWNDSGEIFASPTLSVLASDFVGRYITIQNTYGTSGKAVALRVSGDRAAFYSCKILSYQDTLLDDVGKHYFNNCIEGAIDFIFGNAASLYEKCHLHSLSERDGAITAQHRVSSAENTGFTFLGCNITGVGASFLGRPWGASSRVVFTYCHMSSAIIPQGWNDWGDETKQRSVYYGEYKCYGPGANRSKRVGWSRSLTSDEAAQFLTKDMIGGKNWLRDPPIHFKRASGALVSLNSDENE
ncbi:Putative pectinesterase 11 [Morus notabilis]|uniref:Pectinesterase n=1 Tax=Morus notabilis TaxID=981085 RepID=W9R2S4_9ROSA|nr:putative pectinesterase 11 [Morus notabilis]EXB37139.1 Putative pectinesterase 11 [Morus notabilis]